MKKPDKKLLDSYMKGFNAELSGYVKVIDGTYLELRAYKLGANHAILGDDNRSFDYLSTEQILNIIRDKKR